MVAQHVMERDGADADVATVANLCMKLAYNNKGANHGHGLSAAMICAGWDTQRGGQVRGVCIATYPHGCYHAPCSQPYHSSAAAPRLGTFSLREALGGRAQRLAQGETQRPAWRRCLRCPSAAR
jgi:hypothetical protein